MAKIFRKPSSVKLPERDREPEHEEYGREFKGIEECPICRNVKFKKRWYHSIKEIRPKLKNPPLKISSDRQELCPACGMIKNHVFEGEIFIDNFSEKERDTLLNLIKNFEKEALRRDPQDRIIQIERTKTGYRITTTENQMANRLAKKIKDAFKTAEAEFSHSQEPFEVNRVHVDFLEK